MNLSRLEKEGKMILKMQIFELHFNPRLKEDLIFDSFCYEPENVYERRLGSLYIVGELKNTLPQNLKLISNLAQVIKSKFYALPISTLEKSLRESLKRANEFLAEEVKKENTSWLGNLSLVLISLKNFDLNFTKVGDLKILLSRGGKIIDIGMQLDTQEIEPYPLKIFQNIVSGKLAKDDLIFILTKGTFDFFERENLIEGVAKIPAQKTFEKELKKILKIEEKLLEEISGICLLISLRPEALPKKILAFERKIPLFPFGKFLNQIRNFPSSLISQIRGFLKIPGQFLEKIKNLPRKIKISLAFKRKVILIILLISFLVLGFFIFRKEREEEIKKLEMKFQKIEEKVAEAENFLIFREEKKANSLFLAAFEEILPLTKEEELKQKANSIKEKIEKNLFLLNKLERVEPELFFEFKDFFPQKMVLLDKTLYFFNPYNNWLYKFEERIETEEKFNLAIPFIENSILFFSRPDKLILFKDGNLGKALILKEPYQNFNVSDFTSFRGNLYFLDGKLGEIIKYPAPLIDGKDFPQFWLSKETKKFPEAKSIAIDGAIWILTKNEIHKYFAGKYIETLKLDLFPFPKSFEKIFTNEKLAYLYLLESGQKRVIILEKSGKVIKQFQSDKFDNLKDFAISENGKEIYLLAGQKVYKIEI